MATTVTNSANELLWQPNDFGSYSVEKIQVISDILSDLLQSFSIDTNIKVDDETLSLFYTKEEINEKLGPYIHADNARPLIQGIVDTYLEGLSADNSLLTEVQYNYFVEKITYLYSNIYSRDIDGNTLPPAGGQDISTRINSVELLSSSLREAIYTLQLATFVQNGTSGLDTTTTRFYTKSEIDTTVAMLQNAIDGKGSAGVYATWEAHNTLQSTVTDLQGRVTANENSIRTINNTLSSHASAISNKLDTSSFSSHIVDYNDYTSNNDDRVTALENRTYIKSATFTDTTDSDGKIRYSSISDFGITDGTVIISVDFSMGSYGSYRRVEKYNYSTSGYVLVFYEGNTFGQMNPVIESQVTFIIWYI